MSIFRRSLFAMVADSSRSHIANTYIYGIGHARQSSAAAAFRHCGVCKTPPSVSISGPSQSCWRTESEARTRPASPTRRGSVLRTRVDRPDVVMLKLTLLGCSPCRWLAPLHGSMEGEIRARLPSRQPCRSNHAHPPLPRRPPTMHHSPATFVSAGWGIQTLYRRLEVKSPAVPHSAHQGFPRAAGIHVHELCDPQTESQRVFGDCSATFGGAWPGGWPGRWPRARRR